MLVGLTPVCVLPANPKRRSYAMVNNGGATIFLGADAGVTTSSGEPLAVGAMVSDDSDPEAVWAVSGTADQDIRVTEIIKAD